MENAGSIERIIWQSVIQGSAVQATTSSDNIVSNIKSGLIGNNVSRLPSVAVEEATSSNKLDTIWTCDSQDQVKCIPLEKVVKKFQQYYKKLSLPRVSWMSGGRGFELDQFYATLQLESSKTRIQIESIFDKIQGVPTRRILIEGQPGFGKTTLALKLAYDWAMHRSYLKKFKLAIVIQLGCLQNETIEEEISLQIGVNFSSTRNLLEEYEDKILLILDGLDELAESNRQSILHILYKIKWSKMTVVVTCRTSEFSTSRDELKKLFCYPRIPREFSDRRVQIVGIMEEDRKAFLHRFLSHESNERIFSSVEKIMTLDETFSQLMSCPLILMLLTFIVSTSSPKIFSSKTELLKALFSCIIKRSLSKRGGDEDQVSNLFHFDQSKCGLNSLIHDFGKLAKKLVLERRFRIECNELTEQVYSLGLLTKGKRIFFFNNDYFYEPMHLSILEFAAAYSVSVDYFSAVSTDQVLKPIAQSFLRFKELNHFFPLLIGLLREKAIDLFTLMETHAFWFTANENYLWNMLTEVLPDKIATTELYPAVAPLLSPWIQLDSIECKNFYSTNRFLEIIKFGVNNERINRITVNSIIDAVKFPLDITLPHFLIRINETSDITSYIYIKCDQLTFIFDDILLHSEQSEESLYKYFKLFTSIQAQERNISLCSLQVFIAAKKYLIEQNVTTLKLHHVNAKLTNQSEIAILEQLVEKNQITSLNIQLQELLDINNLLNSIAMSPSVKSFRLLNTGLDTIAVDLFQLTQCGTKNYKFLQFENCAVTWSDPTANFTGIHSLNLSNCSEVNSIASIQSKVLTCKASQLQIESSKEFLQELILRVDDSTSDPNVWDTLVSSLKNLEILGLRFYETVKKENSMSIAKCIAQLSIKRLILENYVEKYDPRKKVITYLLKDCDNLHVLDQVDYHFSFGEDDQVQLVNLSSGLSDLLVAVRENKVVTVNVVCSKEVWSSMLQEEILDHSLFSLSHYYYGSRNDDAECYKYLYNCVISKLNSFSIKKITV